MPTTFRDMADRWRALDIEAMAADAMQKSSRALEDYNRRRLMKGLGTDGQYLPKYETDPYFKGNLEWARAYAAWKHTITPEAPFGVMTFYINGYTHNRIEFSLQTQSLSFAANVAWGQDIQTKTGGKALGLSQADVDDYRPRLNRLLVNEICRLTGAI